MSEWRDIPGHPEYRVSDDGVVQSKKGVGCKPMPSNTWKTVKGWADAAGYRAVRLSPGKNPLRVHALVLLAFVGPRPTGLETRHLNGDPADNRLENLVYGTPKENIGDNLRLGTHRSPPGSGNGRAVLTEEDVLDIRRLVAAGSKQCDVAARFDVHCSTVNHIVNRRTWRHV